MVLVGSGWAGSGVSVETLAPSGGLTRFAKTEPLAFDLTVDRVGDL